MVPVPEFFFAALYSVKNSLCPDEKILILNIRIERIITNKMQSIRMRDCWQERCNRIFSNKNLYSMQG